MMNILSELFTLPRYQKRLIQIFIDITATITSFWVAIALRLDGIGTNITFEQWILILSISLFNVCVFVKLGLYRAVIRYMSEKAVVLIFSGCTLSSIIILTANYFFTLGLPRSVPFIYLLILILVTGGVRLAMRVIYLSLWERRRVPAAIGGDETLIQPLALALDRAGKYRPRVLFSEDKRLFTTTVGDIPIKSLKDAKKMIIKNNIKIIFLIFSDKNAKRRIELAKLFLDLGVEVKIVPNAPGILERDLQESNFEEINIEELLFRKPIAPNSGLMKKSITKKSVLITGAGGSIGSQLCREMIALEPTKIVLLEHSEYALYELLEELRETLKDEKYNIRLVPVLGSVTDEKTVRKTIRHNNIQSIFHAAAYKHVPLLEENSAAALINNVVGTIALAKTAGELGIESFTLISSDKAVRPTNIMGASKRLSEKVVASASSKYPETKFSSVRFGNVLGSSGSIVPKFKKQILNGGPITLTHREITRYFMTIPEAAQLVIQASALGGQGKLYVLDMGAPIRLVDLARTMCVIYGKHLHEGEPDEAPPGTVQLVEIGLRPGEKLYEELLVDGQPIPTEHPKIMCEETQFSDLQDLDELKTTLYKLRSRDEIIIFLKNQHLGYHPNALDKP